MLQPAVVDHETVEVLNALRGKGIRAILLKGPVTAELYDDPIDRPYEDADVLVDPVRLPDARAVLEGIGFRRTDSRPSPHEPFAYDEKWVRAAIVDLHHTLSGIGADPRSAWNILSRETRLLRLGDCDVEVPSAAARALVVALHAAHHGVRAERPKLDLAQALERVPLDAWSRAATLAAELDAVPAFLAGLRLLDEGEELARQLVTDSSRSVETELRASSAPNMALMLVWLRRGSASRREKLALVLRKVFPPREWLRETSPVARRGKLGLAQAYVARPLQLAGRLPKALLSLRRAARATSTADPPRR